MSVASVCSKWCSSKNWKLQICSTSLFECSRFMRKRSALAAFVPSLLTTVCPPSVLSQNKESYWNKSRTATEKTHCLRKKGVCYWTRKLRVKTHTHTKHMKCLITAQTPATTENTNWGRPVSFIFRH